MIKRQWGETEYMICAVPLGGYVQMLGEGGGEDGEHAELIRRGSPLICQKADFQTGGDVAAGPFMNLILPFVVLPVSYMVGVNMPAYLEGPPCVGYVVPGSEGFGGL